MAVVPMINIIFLLLLYFLVAGRLTEDSAPAVQLPVGGAERHLAPSSLTLHITAGDDVFIKGKAVDEIALRRALATIADQPSHHVLIRADARASARALHRIMAAGGSQGLQSFELATLEAERADF